MATALSLVQEWERVETAAEYKGHVERLITALKEEAMALSGKQHHKERTAKGKTIAELCCYPRYIDACRVAKGLAPGHGFFAAEVGEQGGTAGSFAKGIALSLSPEEAAGLAESVEKELAELEPKTKQKQVHAHDLTQDVDLLVSGWQKRMAKLEAKLMDPVQMPPKGMDDIDELEDVAQEIVDFRLELKKSCGYREKDLKEDAVFQKLEERLDVLAGAYLPEEQPALPEAELKTETEELRQWERRLSARLAKGKAHHSSTHLCPSKAKEVQKLLAEVAELKASLRAKGLKEHEQDKDEQVLMRLVRLAELQQFQTHDKKIERREKQELGAIREEVQQLISKLEAHKQRLRNERGDKHKSIKEDPEICELEERLAVLQKMGGI